MNSLAPGLHWIAPRRPAPLAAAALDVPAFVGIAARGPVGSPVVIEGWPAFRAAFGGLLAGAHLAWTVRAFFENGGRRCHVVRIAAPAARTRTRPAVAQPADRLSSEVADTRGFAPGAAARARQEIDTTSDGAQPADRLASVLQDVTGLLAGDRVAVSQAGMPTVWRRIRGIDAAARRIGWDAALPAGLDLALPIIFTVARDALVLLQDVTPPGTLRWSRALPPFFSLPHPIRFDTGAAAAGGTLFDEDGAPLIEIAAASPGAWGNEVEVRLLRSVSAETRTRRIPAPDPAGALSVETLTGFLPGATLTVAQQGAVPVRRRLAGIDGAARRLRLDAALPGDFDLAAARSGAAPITIRRETFALSVLEQGRLAETHASLDLPAEGEIAAVSARSRLIRARRLPGAPGWPLPDPAAGPHPPGRMVLAGGRDGVAAITAEDLLAGIEAFAHVDEPAAIAVPDAQPERLPAAELLPPPAPVCDPCALDAPPVVLMPDRPSRIREAMPPLGLAALRAVQRAMIAQCEARGDRIALLDAPRDADAADPFDPDAARDWVIGLESRFAALYWPWLQAADSDDPRAASRLVPPCGHVLGATAASDLRHGPQRAPANTPLEWVQAVAREADEPRRVLLNEAGVNVIRALQGRGIRAYGARVTEPVPDHALLNRRRVLILLRRSLRQGFAWLPFEPDNAALRRSLRAALEAFLEDLWRRGMLAGGVAGEAFRVAIDPPGAAGEGTLLARIAVAPVAPAEFVLLTLTRQDEAIDIAEPLVPAGERA